MNNKSVILKKYLIVILGQIIIGIGCAFMVKSGMGNDTMGVMISGLSKTFGIQYGTMNNAVSLLIFFAMLVFYRKRISFTTLITAVVIGWTIDPVLALLGRFTVPVAVNNFVYPLLGCFIICLGVAFYLSIDFGAGITDNVILWLCDMGGNKPYSFGCYICYIVYFIIGVLTGGTWGYATVVTILVNGKIIDFLLPFFKKTVAVWANRE